MTLKSPLCPIGSPAHVDLSSVLGCSGDQALTLNRDRHLNQTKLWEFGKLAKSILYSNEGYQRIQAMCIVAFALMGEWAHGSQIRDSTKIS